MAAAKDAIKLLKDDHNSVKKLFKDFEKASGKKKLDIARQTLIELQAHAKIEEEIFYPKYLEMTKDEELTAEAEEEHHVAEVLMEELTEMLSSSETDVHFDAKYMVMAESVKHHIEEEEGEMFPKAEKKMDKELLKELGEEMIQRREQVLAELDKQLAKV